MLKKKGHNDVVEKKSLQFLNLPLIVFPNFILLWNEVSQYL